MGTLYSYTVAHRPVSPHFADAVPQLRVGMRVQPVFCDYPEHDVTLLRYQPAD